MITTGEKRAFNPTAISCLSSGVALHLILLFFLIILAYSNTFHAAWHLDDIPNILDNKNIQVSRLSLDDWARSLHSPFSDPAGTKPGLYRPVAMLSFAFNWYLGGADVFGYHLVNTGIHCVTSALLFFTILSLLRAPNMKGRYQGSEHFIALLAAALWALHPIQTQTVTYIVQRMAGLAALFYLSGIFWFVKGRMVRTPGRRGLLYGLCLTSFLLAAGSKQNAVTFPAALLLIEVIFFKAPGFWKQNKAKWAIAGIIAGLALMLVLLLFFWQKNPLTVITEGYRMRPFSLTERLLTEFRVLVFYLHQLFYPVSGQFSIIHEFDVSKSLLDPWTTLAALMFMGTLIITASYRVHRWPLWSFSIGFFFLGHSVESTIFPLELVFEHRNYLPSLFLFAPVASGIKRLIDTYRGKSRLVYFLLLSAVPLLIAALVLGTHTRNMAWATEKTLWQDAIQKAPSLARPHQGLALALERENRLDDARMLYEKALELKDPAPELSRFVSYSNIGNIYKQKKEYEKAVHYLTAALNIPAGPYVGRVRYNLVLCLLNTRSEEEALHHLEYLLDRQQDNWRFLSIKGFIFFQQGKSDLALHHLRQALNQNPHDRNVLVATAMVLSSKEFYENAASLLEAARKESAKNLIVHLALLQNALKMEDKDKVTVYLSNIMNLFTIDDIEQYLAERASGHHFIHETVVPLDDRMVVPPLVHFLKQKAERWTRIVEEATP